MFYGSGAGKLPTASAVVADVVDAAKHLHRNVVTRWDAGELELIPECRGRASFLCKGSGQIRSSEGTDQRSIWFC